MKKISILSILAMLILLSGCKKNTGEGPGGDGSPSAWEFTEDGVTLNITGVSPEAIVLDGGSIRLYVTDKGIKVYKAFDGLTFQEETGTFPPGSDPTLIALNSGGYRMYYVDHGNTSGEIKTARSDDGLIWSTEASTGIQNTTGTQAWGVPDSIQLPDGRIRLYWVNSNSENSLETILSAISSDGTTFTQESGNRTENGYVDPYILYANEGDWVALLSTTPHEDHLPQKIYLATSTDGLTWTIEGSPIITVTGGNALDPTAVPLGDGSYRVYYSVTPGSDPFQGHYIKSGILKKK